MKKRVIVALLLLALVPALTFAHFIQFGPTFSYDLPIDTEAEKKVDFDGFDYSAFTVGGDFRLTPVKFLQLQTEARGHFDKELKLTRLDAFVAGNLRFDLYVADFTVGGGLKSTLTSNIGKWTFDGHEFVDAKTLVKNSQLFYRAGLALNLGRISVSAEGIFPTNLSVDGLREKKEQSILESLTPDMKKTQVSVGFLINLF